MSRLLYFKLTTVVACYLCHLLAHGQLSSQGFTTNYGGGTLTGGALSSEISTGQFSGNPSSENFGFKVGFAAFNLESGVVSMTVRSGGEIITESLEALLLRVEESGNYDTLDQITNNGGDFAFNPVFLGDYLVVVDSDPEQYVATYYGDEFLWEEADILAVEGDTATQIIMTIVPPVLDENDGDGNVSGTIEEDFEDDEGRITARRRAAKRKCGLRRKRSGGRTGQNDEFELIAYGETNENGEFEYGFLPQGTYRFFVEYPGIPLDESSFVEFDIGEAGVSDNTFVLAAVVTETGITVELVLGLTSEFFTDFNIYPNPTVDVIHVDYDQIKSEKVIMDLIDMNGKTLSTMILEKGENGNIRLDLGSYENGQYLLRFFDSQKNKTALTFRIIKQ